jgi:hypothetical protein
LPGDLKELLDVSYLTNVGASSRTLRRINESQADIQDPDALGVSDTYVLFRDFIEFWPSPNSAYSVQLRYRQWAPDLTGLTDTPSLSTPFRHAVLLKSEQFLHEYLGNDERAVNAEFRYQQFLSQVATDEGRRQKGQSRGGVAPVW